MWVSKWKNLSVHFGFIHDVIWRGPPTSELTMGKSLILSKHLCVKSQFPLDQNLVSDLLSMRCKLESVM